VFCLENLNTAVDHPGTPFGKAADTLALAEAVDSPALKLMLDLYHAQIGEGNVLSWSAAVGPRSARSRLQTYPGAVSREPRRSTTRPSPVRWPRWGTTARSGSRPSPQQVASSPLERFRATLTL
jgi:hypothetical protein